MDRKQNLERVRETLVWDIVVIGGGATGVGCAVDAATRGYSVLLLEQADLGKGTSSRSTKLIHGGVRYLRQGNISLVREALRERGILLRNAPHVVHKQEFIVPCYSLWQKLLYGVGLKIYDLLAGNATLGRSQILSRSETLGRLPTIAEKGLVGGILYTDGQFDDTRLLIDLAQTAAANGACILNYARVDGFLRTNDKVSGVRATDQLSVETFEINAKCVINATGAFCDAVRLMSDANAMPVVTFSQGIHVVLDRKFLPDETAIMIPKTSDGRILFCIPWLGHTLVGTTDTPIDTVRLEPTALESEIDFVLSTAGQYLASKATRDDILSVFAGIRPLVKRGNSTRTSAISRGHDLFVDPTGLVTITGGKWTTYRQMAEDAMNKAADVARLEKRDPMTATLPIEPPTATANSERLHPDLTYTEDDVLRAVRDEMAQTVEDVLARRTRALFLNARAAIDIAPRVAEIMAGKLGKDDEWVDDQVCDFENIAAVYLGKLTTDGHR